MLRMHLQRSFLRSVRHFSRASLSLISRLGTFSSDGGTYIQKGWFGLMSLQKFSLLLEAN